MAIEKITETELDQIGLKSVGDTPEDPKEALEAVERQLLVPKINEIVAELEVIAPEGGAGDMRKDAYDTDKNGVVDYSENGFGTYTYAKDGTQHLLTNPIGYENIRFVPTADFNDGDTFKVNGEAVTAKTQDGEPLSGGYFKAGNVVTAFLNGDTLNFKSGGAGLNFAVVGGTTQPASPKENTIWVNTDTAISGWAFSNEEPSNPKTGMLWAQTGLPSQASFNAAKGNELRVYPISARQYVGSAWVKKEAKIYSGGEWKSWAIVLYDNGEATTFRLVKGDNSSSSDTVFSDMGTYIQIGANGSANYIYAITDQPVAMDGITSIRLAGKLWAGDGTGNGGARARICVAASKDFGNIAAEGQTTNTATTETAIDFSLSVSLKGSYYVGVRVDRNSVGGTRRAFCNIEKLSMG